MEIVNSIKTSGWYTCEENACGEFDGMLNTCRNDEGAHWFRVEREVIGSLMQPHAFCNECYSVRIDRVLIPLLPAIQAGWRWGSIGVECKNSGVKIGRAVCQALDYRRSVFKLSSGNICALDQVFIWPVDRVSGDIASVMMQNRIGIVRFDRDTINFEFMFNGTCALKIGDCGLKFNEAALNTTGRKVGSR